MEPEILLEELKEILFKLGISLELKNLDDEEVTIKSGYCEVPSAGGKSGKLIIDRRFPARDRNSVIIRYLRGVNLDSIYMTPEVRELIESGRE